MALGTYVWSQPHLLPKLLSFDVKLEHFFDCCNSLFGGFFRHVLLSAEKVNGELHPRASILVEI